MPIVPTWLHGAMDYALAVLVIFSPWLLAYDDQGAASWSAIVLAGVVILYSLFTHYEFALVRRIPMMSHLAMDAAVGLALVLSPWALGFVEDTWVWHVAAGALWIIGAFVTQTVPMEEPAA